MGSNIKCGTCGLDFSASTAEAPCPRCLLGLGVTVGDEDPQRQREAPPRRTRRFAAYELTRQIGCGGMGVVYEAQQDGLNRTVALKMILDSQVCSPVARRRFFIEAEAAARLDHPNIVPIYEVGEYEEQPFLSMKFIQGETLRKRIDGGEFRIPSDSGTTKSAKAEIQRKISRFIATVAQAVHHAHTQNILHRDLKPGNILIDADGKPHLTDFGLAKILDDQNLSLTDPTAILGTPAYMAPEQVRAERVTEAADTYSLGVIFYELLTGQLPFRGSTSHETMKLIETQTPTRPGQINKHVNKDLETICLKCLEKDPANRYESTKALADDLDRWQRHEPIKAHRTPAWMRVGRWTQRNRVGTALILTLILALIASSVVIQYILAEAKNRELIRRAVTVQLAGEIEQIWSNPERINTVVTAEMLAILSNRLLPASPAIRRLTIELNIEGSPVAQAQAFTPLLYLVQDQMSRILGEPIIFDLKLCKMGQFSLHEILSGETDFQRLGAVSYVRAKDLSPGVEAMVQEDDPKKGIVFVQRNSPITNLSDFQGRSFAFGDTNSTINLWTKVDLVHAGIRGTNLSHYASFNESIFSEAESQMPARVDESKTGLGAVGPKMISGADAALNVRNGEFDGCSIRDKYFRKLEHKTPKLRAIHSITSTPNVYVARAGLEPSVLSAFRQAMLSIKDTEKLRALPFPVLEGYQPPNHEEFDRIRSALSNEAAQFEISATNHIRPAEGKVNQAIQ